jgi:hypothetical protein
MNEIFFTNIYVKKEDVKFISPPDNGNAIIIFVYTLPRRNDCFWYTI